MTRTIFDNYDFDRKEVIDCILENNEDLTIEDITEEMIYDWWHSDCEIWFDAEYHQLKNYFKDDTIICFGSVERWCGMYEGGRIFDDFEKAFREMTVDCDYIKIYEDNNHLYIKCSHHDGTNYFEIKKLTEKGKEYYDNWCYSWDNRSEQYIHNQIIKYYSRLPRYCKNVWGC